MNINISFSVKKAVDANLVDQIDYMSDHLKIIIIIVSALPKPSILTLLSDTILPINPWNQVNTSSTTVAIYGSVSTLYIEQDITTPNVFKCTQEPMKRCTDVIFANPLKPKLNCRCKIT